MSFIVLDSKSPFGNSNSILTINAYYIRGDFMLNLADILTIIAFTFCVIVLLILIVTGFYVHHMDRSQKQHPVLRNYPIVGRARYFFETIGPELRQYLFSNDLEGK